MGKGFGWLFLIGAALAGYGLYAWEKNNSGIPGAIGSLGGGTLGFGPAVETLQGMADGVLGLNTAGQPVGLPSNDPDSDAGASPTITAQTEAAYNQGSSATGLTLGNGNDNDEDSLDSMFSSD